MPGCQGLQCPRRVLKAQKRGSTTPTKWGETMSPLPLTNRGSFQRQISHELHCSCQITISQALIKMKKKKLKNPTTPQLFVQSQRVRKDKRESEGLFIKIYILWDKGNPPQYAFAFRIFLNPPGGRGGAPKHRAGREGAGSGGHRVRPGAAERG